MGLLPRSLIPMGNTLLIANALKNAWRNEKAADAALGS